MSSANVINLSLINVIGQPTKQIEKKDEEKWSASIPNTSAMLKILNPITKFIHLYFVNIHVKRIIVTIVVFAMRRKTQSNFKVIQECNQNQNKTKYVSYLMCGLLQIYGFQRRAVHDTVCFSDGNDSAVTVQKMLMSLSSGVRWTRALRWTARHIHLWSIQLNIDKSSIEIHFLIFCHFSPWSSQSNSAASPNWLRLMHNRNPQLN